MIIANVAVAIRDHEMPCGLLFKRDIYYLEGRLAPIAIAFAGCVRTRQTA